MEYKKALYLYFVLNCSMFFTVERLYAQTTASPKNVNSSSVAFPIHIS